MTGKKAATRNQRIRADLESRIANAAAQALTCMPVEYGNVADVAAARSGLRPVG